jgi:hypothetical protein
MSLARLLLARLAPLALALAAPPAAAGAWTLAPGAAQTIFTVRHVEADRAFDAGGRLTRAGAYRKTELSAFVEWGLTEGLTAFAQGTLQSKTVTAPVSDDRFGPDYTEIGLRARLARREGVVLSAQGSLRLPGASDARAPAEIGSTELETDARLLAGRGFEVGGLSGWLDLQGGRRFRDGAPPDEWRVDATLGLRPRPGWMTILQAFGKVAAGDATGGFPEASSLDLQGSLARELSSRWTVQAGLVGTVWGREAAREIGGFVSLWRRF